MPITSSTLTLLYAKYRFRIFFSVLIIFAYYFYLVRPRRKKPITTNGPAMSSDIEIWSAMTDFKEMDPIAFEKLAGEIIKLTGYRVIEHGELSKDGGIDLIAENAISHSLVGIQCKKYYRDFINLKEMREFYGALCAGGYKRGIYVTLKGYTKDAAAFALDHNIDTWDAIRLKETARENIASLSEEAIRLLNSKIQYCGECYSRMTVKRAQRGSKAGQLYWMCTERGCRRTSNF